MEKETQLLSRDITEPVLGKYLIDCDTNPTIPEGWFIREEDQLPNRAKGQLKWNSTNAKLLCHPKQKKGVFNGYRVKDWLADDQVCVYRANVLDYLLTNPHLIPKEWKPGEQSVKFVFFWGDVYRDPNEVLYVRWLYWGDGWQHDYSQIAAPWHIGDFAAALTS